MQRLVFNVLTQFLCSNIFICINLRLKLLWYACLAVRVYAQDVSCIFSFVLTIPFCVRLYFFWKRICNLAVRVVLSYCIYWPWTTLSLPFLTILSLFCLNFSSPPLSFVLVTCFCNRIRRMCPTGTMTIVSWCFEPSQLLRIISGLELWQHEVEVLSPVNYWGLYQGWNCDEVGVLSPVSYWGLYQGWNCDDSKLVFWAQSTTEDYIRAGTVT